MRLLRRNKMSDLKYYLIIVFLLFGCTKTEVYSVDEEYDLQEKITALQQENAAIDNYQQKSNIALFLFSNGIVIGIDTSNVPVLSIGIQGYWRCNGVLTDVPIDSEDVNSLLRKDGIIRGVIEGYEKWSFCFENNEVISFGKSLFESDPDVWVRGVNHRGYCVDAPENTLPAYRLSKLNGFHFAEADIRFTSDGVPVLIHDATVDRTSTGSGSVSSLRFDEIRNMDFGGWKSDDFLGTKIPSLIEFLDLCRNIDLRPYIELKAGTKAQVESIVSLVEAFGLRGKATYISFSSSLLKYIIDFDPTASVGFLTSSVSESSVYTALGLMTGLNYVFIDSSDYSDTAIALCENAFIPMEVWTIDSKSIIKALPPYISGVTSNRYHAGRVKHES